MTNNYSASYSYSLPTNISEANTFWDLGSIWCDSIYDGVCDAMIKLPDEGCGGPGCGAEMWQYANGECKKTSDFTYSSAVREKMSFIWPESLYGRYYSTCNSNVKIKYQRNCRCDTRCHYFGECCFDAPPVNGTSAEDIISTDVEPLEYTCMPTVKTEKVIGYALVSSCASDAEPEIQDLCLSGIAGEWSPLGWPVYDPETTLSYKNAHCAACNHVNEASIKHWTLQLDCTWNTTWQNCRFRGYKHPSTLDGKDPYWCYQQGIISTCPPYYNDWRISKKCKEPISSWVYQNQTIYRNAFCAICNLGDDILMVNVELLEGFVPLSVKFTNFLSNALDYVKDDFTGLIEIDVDQLTCCFQSDCGPTATGLWGEVNIQTQCKNLPFNTSCYNSESWLLSYPSTDLLLQDFCLILPDFRPPSPGLTPIELGQSPSSIFTPPSYAEFFFSYVGEIPAQITLNTSWEMIVASASICSNGSLIESGGTAYSKFQLTSSGIQGRDEVVGFPDIGLDIHDYIFISLSLLSLLGYVIWMLVNWKKRASTKLIQITLLVNHFIALVFWSTSTLATSSSAACVAVAFFIQYFFLTSITWTNVIAIDITWTIYRVSSSSRSMRKYLVYSIYAFGLPLALSLTTFALSFYEKDLNLNTSVYRLEHLCFILNEAVIYSLFIGPLVFIVVVNIALCVACFVRVNKKVNISSTDKDRTTKNAITCIKLSVVFGIGWMCLFFGVYDIVLAFVELQGVLLVLAHLISWSCLKKFKSKWETTFPKGSSTQTTELTSLAGSNVQTPINTPSLSTKALHSVKSTSLNRRHDS
ncbi:uncharacterized protein [Watersipora subatra]|uniref:uncharacterized protein n=1 Tax=Watersipora subatra TaxID=2589382 RepID=UPI00355B5867